MFHATPPGARICLITDVRTLANANADVRRKPMPGHQSVHDFWKPGIAAFGKHDWFRRVARVSLFEFGEDVKPATRHKAKDDLLAYLDAHKFEQLIVVASRSKSAKKVYNDDYAEAKHSGTVCWTVLDPPGNIASMQGTFWQTPYGRVLPLQNPQNIDYAYGAMFARWLYAIKGHMPLFVPPAATSHIEPTAAMYEGLKRIHESVCAGRMLALDIESFSTENLITVLGLSDGVNTCAVPWQAFRPHGQDYIEPGFASSDMGRLAIRIIKSAQVLTGHNFIAFDMPMLAAQGIQTKARLLDSYLLHGVLYNQFRHGLQQCVSYEYVVPPWKSLHSQGKDTDDPNAWIQNPLELRTYNLSDTFYQWHLTNSLIDYMGGHK